VPSRYLLDQFPVSIVQVGHLEAPHQNPNIRPGFQAVIHREPPTLVIKCLLYTYIVYVIHSVKRKESAETWRA